MIIIAILYTFVATILALYGFHVFVLVVQFLRHRNRKIPHVNAKALNRDTDAPYLIVQLPVYNERYLVERVIDAAAALDWPSSRLQIQVIDDSTDDTTALALARVNMYRQRGVDITLIHRTNRDGYKAGALADGLSTVQGEFVAVFDADFQPAPDFLRCMMPYFDTDESVGFVQARWGHLNYAHSALTRALALMIDGHFVVEQFARVRSGWPMAFNGSAGIWRRACIESVGGWQDDTLCEDMDLSYRAMLAGWLAIYVPEVVVPQEIPISIGALKVQQGRWARGGTQCLRKHIVPILSSRRLSVMQKLMGVSHLAGFLAHLALVFIVLLWLPLALDGQMLKHLPLTFLGLTGLSLPIEYVVSQLALFRDGGVWIHRLAFVPILLVVGMGTALNNGLAVLAGLFTQHSEFQRTPKIGAGVIAPYGYQTRGELVAWMEIALALYALAAVLVGWSTGNLTAVLFLLIYVVGLGSVGIGSLLETARAKRTRTQSLSSQNQLG